MKNSTFDANTQTVFPNTGFGVTSQQGDATAVVGLRGSKIWAIDNNSFVYQNITFDADTEYTISVYAKGVTGPFTDPFHFYSNTTMTQKPKLLDQVSQIMRGQHYSLQTEKPQ